MPPRHPAAPTLSLNVNCTRISKPVPKVRLLDLCVSIQSPAACGTAEYQTLYSFGQMRVRGRAAEGRAQASELQHSPAVWWTKVRGPCSALLKSTVTFRVYLFMQRRRDPSEKNWKRNWLQWLRHLPDPRKIRFQCCGSRLTRVRTWVFTRAFLNVVVDGLNCLIFVPVQTRSSFCGLRLYLLLQNYTPVFSPTAIIKKNLVCAFTLSRKTACLSSHFALSQPELSGRRFAAFWNWQDAPSRDALRLPLTSG